MLIFINYNSTLDKLCLCSTSGDKDVIIAMKGVIVLFNHGLFVLFKALIQYSAVSISML